VLESVPDHCVAVGAPARVVRSFDVAQEPIRAAAVTGSHERRTVD
jgi:acetyltransferase-like isoleucine patch superfamily enzyme